MSWLKRSVHVHGKTGVSTYARRREAMDELDDLISGLPKDDPAVWTVWAWRYRHALGPVYAFLGLLIAGGIAHDYAAGWWPLGLVLGGLATAAAWRWAVNRRPERVYVLVSGAAATIWTTLVWWASVAHDWIILSGLTGALIACIPLWWHNRIRGKITVQRGAPRNARRELRRIVKRWPDMSHDIDLSGSRIQRAEADSHGYSFTLALRGGLTTTDVLNSLPRVESVLETPPGAARVRPDPDRAHRAVIHILRHDPLEKPIPWPHTQAVSVNEPVVLGRFENGDLVEIRLVGTHVLIGGATGRGKSGVLNVTLAELSRRTDVVLWGLDMKYGMELLPWQPVLARLATNENRAVDILTAANSVLDARSAILAERRGRAWWPSPSEPALVIAIDELAELTPRSLALVERIAHLGRAAGIILVAATQRPSAATLGGLGTRSQMTIRIAMGVIEARDGELILGTNRMSTGWRPERLGRPGSFLVLAPGKYDEPRPGRAFLMTDDAVTLAVHQAHPQRPTLDPVSAVAAGDDSKTSQVASDPKPHGSDADQSLLSALRTAPHSGLSVDELARRAGRRRSWVYWRLSIHTQAGRAVRRGPGRWGAPR